MTKVPQESTWLTLANTFKVMRQKKRKKKKTNKAEEETLLLAGALNLHVDFHSLLIFSMIAGHVTG